MCGAEGWHGRAEGRQSTPPPPPPLSRRTGVTVRRRIGRLSQSLSRRGNQPKVALRSHFAHPSAALRTTSVLHSGRSESRPTDCRVRATGTTDRGSFRHEVSCSVVSEGLEVAENKNISLRAEAVAPAYSPPHISFVNTSAHTLSTVKRFFRAQKILNNNRNQLTVTVRLILKVSFEIGFEVIIN